MTPRVFPPVSVVAGFRRMLRSAAWLVGVVVTLPAIGSAQQTAAGAGASASTYHFNAKWKPGGGDAGWDYLTLDSQGHRLYVARANAVQVIDTVRGTLIREIPGLEGGHGIALASDLDRGFATSGENGTVITFNLTSLRPDGSPIPVGKKPDAIVYEPLTRHVFVFNGESDDASVINAATSAVIATIPLGGRPESAAVDARGTVFVNLKDKNEVLSIDAQKNAVTQHWPLAPGTQPTGLAIDSVRNRLFAGCRNGQLIVLDAKSGRRLAALAIGGGVDACAVDPGNGAAFASCGDGTLTIAQEDPAKPGEFRVVETVKTQLGARTMALDPRTHAIYLAAADSEPAPAATASDGPPHSEPAPSTFALLKFTR